MRNGITISTPANILKNRISHSSNGAFYLLLISKFYSDEK